MAQIFFRAANILSFGKYTHREEAEPEMLARLSATRRLAYHTRFLRQVAKSTPQVDVMWNLDEVKRSLKFIAEGGSTTDPKAITAAAKIFTQTKDMETRVACLESLSRIPNRKAKDELLRLSREKQVDPAWKDLISAYLSGPPKPEDPLSASGINASTNRVEQR